MRADGETLAVAEAVGRIFYGTDRERDRALFAVSVDVVGSLAEFYGQPSAVPPLPDVFRGISLESLRQRVQDQAAIAYQFGRYRDAVLTHEGQCARRLEVLRSTARTLLRLREVAQFPERIDEMLTTLSSFVVSVWGKDLELDPRARDWSLRTSRRYDLLPDSWRHL